MRASNHTRSLIDQPERQSGLDRRFMVRLGQQVGQRCAQRLGYGMQPGRGHPRRALTRLEKGQVDSRFSTLMAVHKALMRAGAEFIAADAKGEGVRLATPQ